MRHFNFQHNLDVSFLSWKTPINADIEFVAGSFDLENAFLEDLLVGSSLLQLLQNRTENVEEQASVLFFENQGWTEANRKLKEKKTR